MLDTIVSLGLGAFSITRKKAEKLVDMLIKKGEISREEAKYAINLLLARGEEEREGMKQLFQRELNNILHKYNFATREEILAMQEKIDYLEAKLNESGNQDTQGG